jgi:hypothetical protein
MSRRIQSGAAEAALIFVRSYTCNWCWETSQRTGKAGDATLWTDCDKCKGPAHWCYAIPCNLCAFTLTKSQAVSR